MSPVQNNGGTGGITGKGFMPGQSGNPGGRPKGLAKATRQLVGDDGMPLVAFWLSAMQDETRRDRDRLEASKLLADRGWGKVAACEPQEDPFDFEEVEAAAEEFRRMVLQLAPDGPPAS